MIKTICRALAVAMLALLVGCGGGSVGLSVADGGIGGTGKGTVTGFGSVIINDVHELEISPATEIRIDGVQATEADLKKGMVIQFVADTDLSADFTYGTALTLYANHLVKGPVTSLSPLTVLEQPVVVTGNTVVTNVAGNDVANLNIGDIVEIAGYADHKGFIQASRLEYKAGGLSSWKIVGTASNVNSGTSMTIGSLDVALTAVQVSDCEGALQNGDYVEVSALRDDSYSNGGTLTTATSVKCAPNRLVPPTQLDSQVIEGEFEGYITAVALPSEITVDGQRVLITSTTQYDGGSSVDLVVGSKVEVEGKYDTGNSTLTAEDIRFREDRIRIEGPLLGSDITTGQGFTIMGISVKGTAQTLDESAVLSGPASDRQVEVRGYLDMTNTVIAEEIKDLGTLDNQNVRLRGPVSNIVPTTFEILGVMLDTSTASVITDSNDNVISSSTFFSLISDGSGVEVDAATWDGVSRLDNGSIEIDDE